MATVRSREGKLFIDYRAAGKRKRRSLNLPDNRENKRKAEIIRKQIEAEVASGVYVERLRRIDAKNKTLQQGFDEFLSKKKKLKASSIEHYKDSFDKIIKRIGDIPIRNVTSDMIEKIQDDLEREISSNSIASYFSKLRVLFKYFVEKNYINENVIPRVRMKPKQIVIIPDKELEQILLKLKAHNNVHYKVIALLMLTGLRISEMLALTWEDIDFKQNMIRIRNEKADRIDFIPLHEELREFILREWNVKAISMEVHIGKLFSYKNKDSMKFFTRFLKREGFNHYSFHNLRKTFISKLINSGMSVYDVMTLARHRNIRTTLNHYTAAELDRMGNEITTRANLGTLLGTVEKMG